MRDAFVSSEGVILAAAVCGILYAMSFFSCGIQIESRQSFQILTHASARDKIHETQRTIDGGNLSVLVVSKLLHKLEGLSRVPSDFGGPYRLLAIER